MMNTSIPIIVVGSLALIVVILLLPWIFKNRKRVSFEGSGLSELHYTEVFFKSGDLRLAGLLFLPEGEGPFPTVVIIHGSGTSARNNPWYLAVVQHPQKNRSALSATLILAAFWALWHLPQFFYLFDPAIAIGWLIGLFAGAIVFTWLFNSASGSILILAVWHGCFNFMSASDAGNGVLAAIVSTLVMVWAVFVIVWFKPGNLSRQPKVVSSSNGDNE